MQLISDLLPNTMAACGRRGHDPRGTVWYDRHLRDIIGCLGSTTEAAMQPQGSSAVDGHLGYPWMMVRAGEEVSHA